MQQVRVLWSVGMGMEENTGKCVAGMDAADKSCAAEIISGGLASASERQIREPVWLWLSVRESAVTDCVAEHFSDGAARERQHCTALLHCSDDCTAKHSTAVTSTIHLSHSLDLTSVVCPTLDAPLRLPPFHSSSDGRINARCLLSLSLLSHGALFLSLSHVPRPRVSCLHLPHAHTRP